MLKTDQSHRNNFGLLRLIFAMCVLVSHSFEMVDGNPSREPLTYLFGTITLGTLGVDGFFLVSGYLIAQSFENSTSVFSFVWKRILRIYPAFVVAFTLSIIVVGPLSGADMSGLWGDGWIKQLYHMLRLRTPELPNVFAGLHYPLLNGPMWTIPHEFRCYLLVAVVGVSGFLQRKAIFATALLLLLLFVTLYPFKSMAPNSPGNSLGLVALFFSGSAFYIFREIIPYRNALPSLQQSYWSRHCSTKEPSYWRCQ
jgi:peptidoglycan/LPS O-acetylase OafA/YrhL